MKRKIISILLCAVMVMALAGCSLGGSAEDENNNSSVTSDVGKDNDGNTGNDDLINVGIINNDPEESGYRAANDKDLKKMFNKENGYNAIFKYGKTNEEQIKAASELLKNGIDYLLLSAQDKSGWEPVLQDAEAAGAHVILFDRTIDVDESLYVASIVSDMKRQGDMASAWLKEQKLENYNIVHIQGKLGNDAQIGRTNALNAAVKANGWKLVEQKEADWSEKKAKEIVEKVIASDEKFNVIYAENDNMAKGAVEALDDAGISHGVGKDVVIIGFDCNKFALNELLKKNWNYDGQCNPYQSSYIDDIIKRLEKNENIMEKTIILEEIGLDANTITQEEVDKYGV